MIQKRNPGTALLLSIVTCGIYAIYWEISLVNDFNTITKKNGATSGGMVFLLSLLTCGIYYWYWVYQAGQAIDDVRVNNGLAPSNKAVVNLICAILGLGIISTMLIQTDVNELITLAENKTAEQSPEEN